MDNKTGLLGNVSNAFGGRQGLLTSGLGMMFGGNPQAQQQAMMMGLQQGSQLQAENRKTQQEQAQRNKTLEYLQQSNPELAALMEAGMSGSEALGLAYKAQQPPKAEKPTSAIQNYNFAREQGFDGSFVDWQTGQKRAGATVINNSPNSNEFMKESSKQAAQRLGGIAESANAVPELRGQIEQLKEMSPLIGTGKTAEFLNTVGPYAEAFGINIEGLDAIQAFDSITSKLAPQMRPVGSGSSSDKDVEMFLNSLPSLGNTPQGNQIIAGTFDAVLENRMRAGEIVKLAYIPKEQGGITWWEAEQLIQQLPDPYELFKKSGATDGTSLNSLADTKSKYGLE